MRIYHILHSWLRQTPERNTAMEINKIKKAAEIAKTRTNDKRCVAAIDKAVAGVEDGKWIVTELAHCLAITTEFENTYRANDKRCQCESFFHDHARKH